MEIKEAIQAALRIAYGVPDEDTTLSLKKDLRVKHAKHLIELINLVNDEEHIVPIKVIAQTLEDVVALISLEEEQYAEEQIFLKELKRLYYDPQNLGDNSSLTLEDSVSEQKGSIVVKSM